MSGSDFVSSFLPQFVNNWLTIVLGEREAEGIDFWWLDWQQGEDWIHVPLVNPTFWLNHIFFTNPYTWKNNTVSVPQCGCFLPPAAVVVVDVVLMWYS